jgi:hypothetical protein
MSDYTITDLIKYSVEQKPVDFEQAFNNLISDKLQMAVDVKKIEIAQNMFNSTENNLEDTDSEG